MLRQTLKEIGKPLSYTGVVYRIVETQEYAATTKLTDNLDDQDLLEQMLDKVKPPYKKNTQQRHYLISTPFRYPPLLHGSRFGSVMMPSYFYASENISTTLVECAYYRFVFLDDMTIPYHKAISSEHMSFSVKVKSTAMADLTQVTSKSIIDILTSTSSYQFTQTLASTLIEDNNFDMIRFTSARDSNHGSNVALNSPNLIKSKQPENTMNWICQTTTKKISFNAYGVRPLSFSLESFLVNGVLPRPA